MRIDRLNINGFGKLNNKTILLKPGLNIIYGSNEAGKTTLWNYICGMMFGIEKARGLAARKDVHIRYQPFHNGAYGGTMDVTEGDVHYRIQRNFDRIAKETKLYDLETGKELDPQWITNRFFGMGKEHYLNTLCIGQNNVKYGSSLKETLTNYIANLNSSQNMRLDVKHAIDDLMEQKRKLNRHDLDQELKHIEIRLEDAAAMEQKLMIEIEQERKELVEVPEETSIFPYKSLSIAVAALGMILSLALKNPVFLLVGSLLAICLFIILKHFLTMDRETFLNSLSMVQLELKQEQLRDIKNHKEELKGAYQKIKKKKADILYNIKSIELAIESIRELSNEIHNDFGSILNQEISRTVEQITNGNYNNLKLDEQLGIVVEYQNQFIGLEYLSTGTMEQIYLATRISVAKLMNQDLLMPLMIDDIFGSYDIGRLEQVLEYFRKNISNQMILFTCKQEIKEILDKNQIEYSYISL